MRYRWQSEIRNLRSAILPAILLLALIPPAVAAPDRYEMKLDHAVLTWTAGEGLGVTYDGAPVLVPCTQDLVLHTRDWQRQLWNGLGKPCETQFARQGRRQVLTIRLPSDGCRVVETITAGPGDHFRLEWRCRQDAWDDAVMQLGLPRPAVRFAVGSAFEAKVAGKPVAGSVPTLAPDRTNNPFAGAPEVTFRSLVATLRVTATKPVTFYDYPARASFFLGLDDPLPRGKEVFFAADFALSPAAVEAEGVVIGALQAPDTVGDGVIQVGVKLSRKAGGPKLVQAALEIAGPKPARAMKDVALSGQPTAVSLALRAPVAGRYRLSLVLTGEGGRELFRAPEMTMNVLPLFTVLPGRSLYTSEAQGALLVRTAAGLKGHSLTFEAAAPGLKLAGAVKPGERVALPFDTALLADGTMELSCRLLEGGQELAAGKVTLRKAPPKPNEVKIDYATRGLIVDGLPEIPFGFYCHFPVGSLPEEEVTQGFVHIAPYQSTDADPDQVKAYMDRCAALGMRVHYDVRGLAEKPPTPAKWAKLKALIERVRDHPALLSWYLSDEPDGQGIPAARLEESYRFIKELDPYHPITMVFCVPPKAPDYAGGMDIMMADPYPIPNNPITQVSDVADRLNRAVDYGMPLWIVPQAFGGGEWWQREPSAQEERAMTYLALIHGATGIQYFIRRAPIGNPIAPSLWSECRRLALETQELSPDLLSPEPRPEVQCDNPAIHVAAWRRAGTITLLAANTANAPAAVKIRLPQPLTATGTVLFAGRSLDVKAGVIEDMLDGFGTRAYRIAAGPEPAPLALPDPSNLVANASFEECANTGTPDACYVSVGQDRGASLFVDPRLSVHGRHSLRLCTPAEGQGVAVRPFPIAVKAGKRYRMSLWARGLQDGLKFRFGMRDLEGGEQEFTATRQWACYTVEGTAHKDTRWGQLRLELTGAGTAWFDLMQMVEMP